MAKRRTTDKSSKKATDDAVEAENPTTAEDAKDTGSDTPETVDAQPEVVSADVETTGEETKDAPHEDTASSDKIDDVIELDEPDKIEGKDDVVERDSVVDTDVEGANPEDHISEEDAKKLIEEAELGDDEGKTTAYGGSTETTAYGGSAEDTVADETAQPETSTPPVPVAPEVVRETVVEKKGGFVPMLLGGAVAAALGYGAAAYVSQDVWPFNTAGAEADTFESEIRDTLSAQSETLSGVTDRVSALEAQEPPTVDLSPVQSDIATIQETASGLTTRLDDIAARVDALERQPMEQAVSPEAIAAYERALADLQAEVEAQRAEVAQMAEEAMAAEESAEEQAALAAARAALAEVTTALDTGAGYADALSVLSANGMDVPEVLTANAENGITTQAALMESFPPSARAALAAARAEATESAQGTSRVTTFFANQLGARSVAPREGDDPDAVLSRAEAAVRAGDLDSALSEMSALPEAAQAALADWQASASTRLEAKSAADTLVQQLLQE